MKDLVVKLKWYLVNFPVGCSVLLMAITLSFYIKNLLQWQALSLCVRAQGVLSGEFSNLLTYMTFHENFETFSFSIFMVCTIGMIAERHVGTIYFLFFFTFFAMLSALMAMITSQLFVSGGLFSPLAQRCIALGSSPPLFGIMVIYFHSLPLKRTLFFFITIPVAAIPWCALLFFQLVVPDMNFLSNVSGCAVGTFYVFWRNFCQVLPTRFVDQVDELLSPVSQWCVFPAYIPRRNFSRGIHQPPSNTLPLSNQPLAGSTAPMYPRQLAAVPHAPHVTVPEASVPKYGLKKLDQMGSTEEQGVVALATPNDRLEQVANRSDGEVGDAAVIPISS